MTAIKYSFNCQAFKEIITELEEFEVFLGTEYLPKKGNFHVRFKKYLKIYCRLYVYMLHISK